MKKSLYLLLFIILFSSCSQKLLTKVELTNSIDLKKEASKKIFIKYNNQTNEDVRVYTKLKKAFKSKNYKLVDSFENANYLLDLNLIFANEIEKRSTTKNILSNVNLGVSIGHVFGNVGVSGSIGTKIGTILGDSLDSSSYQIVFDVTIKEYIQNGKLEERFTQVIAETVIDEKPLQYTIDILEDEIAKKIAELF